MRLLRYLQPKGTGSRDRARALAAARDPTPTIADAFPTRDATARRFLFPDIDDTLDNFAKLKAGMVDRLDYTHSTDR